MGCGGSISCGVRKQGRKRPPWRQQHRLRLGGSGVTVLVCFRACTGGACAVRLHLLCPFQTHACSATQDGSGHCLHCLFSFSFLGRACIGPSALGVRCMRMQEGGSDAQVLRGSPAAQPSHALLRGRMPVTTHTVRMALKGSSCLLLPITRTPRGLPQSAPAGAGQQPPPPPAHAHSPARMHATGGGGGGGGRP